MRDRIHHQEQDDFTMIIADLHKKVAKLQNKAWKQIPPGYKENECFPFLTIGNSNSIYWPVNWVKLLDNCTVSGFTEDDRPGSTPHIFHIYAQPTTGGQPVEPLPTWFKELIIGPMLQYHALYKGAQELDDWGIAADITRIHDFDTLEQEATAEIHKWEAQMASFSLARHLARGHLEAA